MSNIKINDVPQRIQYAATGGQTQFTVPFPFFANSYVYVWLNGIQLLQGGAPGQYTVTGAGSPSGGLVTFNTAATLNDIVTIEGIMPIDRTSIYSATISNLTGSDLNGDFNREVVMMQQINTLQQFLQLQYAPWVEVSQDLTVTKDRYIPLLPPLGAWRMNSAGTEIETFLTPEAAGLAPSDATYLIQTANSELPNAQVLALLDTGFMVNQTATGNQLIREFEGTTNQLGVTNPTGEAGNPVYYIVDNPTLPGTAGMGIPAGTTAERVVPTPPNIGLRFNTDLQSIEAYIGGSWVLVPSNGTGYLALTGGTMSGIIDMSNNTIQNVPIPTLNTDVANKEYVDITSAGFIIVNPVRVASTANFSATYDNGVSGVGATLTATVNGAASIDSVALSLNDTVLFKNQTNTYENGIYTVSQIGDGSTPAIYTRSTGFDTPSDIEVGDLVPVLEGTVNQYSTWLQTAVVTTIGTDPIVFVQFGISLNNVVTLTGTQTITGDKTFSGTTVFDNLQLAGNSLSSNSGAVTIDPASGQPLTVNLVGGAGVDYNFTGAGDFDLNLGSGTFNINSTTGVDGIIDDDTMASASATTLATSESIKTYVDAQIALSGKVQLISTIAFSVSTAAIDLTNLSTDYFAYKLEIEWLRAVTDNVAFTLLTSTDNGVNWTTSAGAYKFQVTRSTGATVSSASSASSTDIRFAYNVGNNSDEGAFGEMIIFNPANVAYRTQFVGSFGEVSAVPDFYQHGFSASRNAAEANNAIRLIPSSGNWQNASIKVYGFKA